MLQQVMCDDQFGAGVRDTEGEQQVEEKSRS